MLPFKRCFRGCYSHIEEQSRDDWLNKIDELRTEDYVPEDSDTEIRPHQLLRYVVDQVDEDIFCD